MKEKLDNVTTPVCNRPVLEEPIASLALLIDFDARLKSNDSLYKKVVGWLFQF